MIGLLLIVAAELLALLLFAAGHDGPGLALAFSPILFGAGGLVALGARTLLAGGRA